MRKRAAQRTVLLAIVLATLSGCISIGGGNKNAPPAAIYALHPAGAAKAVTISKGQAAITIAVPKPDVPAGFSTDRIALYLENGRRLDYYEGALWAARLDDLLQKFVIQTARQTLPGKIVDTPDLATSPRFKLMLKVTDFQPVYERAADTPPRLDADMSVTLIALPANTITTQFTVKESTRAAANTQTAVTQGLEKLLQTMMEQTMQKIAPVLR